MQNNADGCSVDVDTVLRLAFRGQKWAICSREQLFGISFLFPALFHMNEMMLSAFQGTGNMFHSSAVDLPIWHDLCSQDLSTGILLCE